MLKHQKHPPKYTTELMCVCLSACYSVQFYSCLYCWRMTLSGTCSLNITIVTSLSCVCTLESSRTFSVIMCYSLSCVCTVESSRTFSVIMCYHYHVFFLLEHSVAVYKCRTLHSQSQSSLPTQYEIIIFLLASSCKLLRHKSAQRFATFTSHKVFYCITCMRQGFVL